MMAELRKDYSIQMSTRSNRIRTIESKLWNYFSSSVPFLDLLFGFFRFPAQKCQVIREKEGGIADY